MLTVNALHRQARVLIHRAPLLRPAARRIMMVLIIVSLAYALLASGSSRLLVVIVTLLLVGAWRFPRWSHHLHCAAAFAGVLLLPVAVDGWPAVVALVYLAIADAPEGLLWSGWAASALGVGVASFLSFYGEPVVYSMYVVAVGGLLGLLVRALDRSTTLNRQGTVLLAQARASEQGLQWLQQRSALARELHDVVGHHVTAMVVQAEAGLVGDLAGAHRALHAVAEAGRSALGELDVLVAHLRDPATAAARVPAPQLRDIERHLSEPLRRQGTEVHVHLDAELLSDPADPEDPTAPSPTENEPATSAGTLDEVVQLSVYRIVQEALTNIARHAHATTTWVEVLAEQGSEQHGGRPHVRVRISDDGAGLVQPVQRGGGLTGMRERAQALGGWCSITRRPGGGTVVDALLPRTVPTTSAAPEGGPSAPSPWSRFPSGSATSGPAASVEESA